MGDMMGRTWVWKQLSPRLLYDRGQATQTAQPQVLLASDWWLSEDPSQSCPALQPVSPAPFCAPLGSPGLVASSAVLCLARPPSHHAGMETFLLHEMAVFSMDADKELFYSFRAVATVELEEGR